MKLSWVLWIGDERYDTECNEERSRRLGVHPSPKGSALISRYRKKGGSHGRARYDSSAARNGMRLCHRRHAFYGRRSGTPSPLPPRSILSHPCLLYTSDAADE